MIETELKLAVPAPDLPKLQRALLDLAPGSACSRSSLTTTYYDTADRALLRRGLSLHVREAAGRFVQTVKAGGTDVLTRGEWEDEIAGAEPDLQAPHSGGRLPAEVANALQPLFTTAVTRTTIAFEPSPSLCIEAAIDEGEISGIMGVAAAPISEIELELKRGEPGALFDAALALLAAAPLHLETRSKAERGYAAIADDAAPTRPVHAAPIALDPEMTVAAALQQVGRACLAHLRHNQAAILDGDPEGVHQMRVALRRLRAMISSLGKMLPAQGRRWVSGELKRLDTILGPARNLDVFADDLLPPVRAAMSEDPALDRLAAALGAARRSAVERVEELIRSPRYTETVLRLLQWFETCGWRGGEGSARSDVLSEPIRDIAPQLLDRRFRRVRKRGKGFRRAGAGRRHKLRIALKELRYTAELLGSLFEQRDVQSFAKRLKTLQDNLGHANDVRVGRDVVSQLCAQSADAEAIAAAGARALGWHEHAVGSTERKVRRRLRRLKRTAPFWKAAIPVQAAAAMPAAAPAPPTIPALLGEIHAALHQARPGQADARDAEAWSADVVDHLRGSLASRFGLAERDFPDAVVAALGGRGYLDTLDRRQPAATLRDDRQTSPVQDLLDALSAHTRQQLAPIVQGLKAEGHKRGAMDRQAIGRFTDELETLLYPGLREHFARMIELLHEQSREEAAAAPRTVAQIATALEHALADHRYELPARLRSRPAAVM